MKKLKGLLVAVMMLCSTSVFAKDFDWSQCWCNYGAGIEKGDMIVDVAVGLNDSFFYGFGVDRWSIPYVDAAFDVALPIWKLPFSWGGFVGTNFSGANGKGWSSSMWYFNFGGQVKYHILLPVDNLDVYAGVRLGANLVTSTHHDEIANKTATDLSGSHFYWSGFLGAHYYLNKTFGFVAEFGHPVWFKAGVSLKF